MKKKLTNVVHRLDDWTRIVFNPILPRRDR